MARLSLIEAAFFRANNCISNPLLNGCPCCKFVDVKRLFQTYKKSDFEEFRLFVSLSLGTLDATHKVPRNPVSLERNTEVFRHPLL